MRQALLNQPADFVEPGLLGGLLTLVAFSQAACSTLNSSATASAHLTCLQYPALQFAKPFTPALQV